MKQPNQPVVELDVREDLRKKTEPFQKIMGAVASLKEEEQLLLHTTFKPVPLIRVLKMKGFQCDATKLAPDHWTCLFYKKNGKPKKEKAEHPPRTVENNEPQVYRLDNRGLQPPEPMVRTLNQLEKAAPGDQVIIHNDRVPVYLLEELDRLGYTCEVEQKEDGSAEVTIFKPRTDGK
ncbi:DUF2249 domain-containing protein [Thermoactinomyces intermedius]|jgi:uncharacterized protein (DUF2249 family)|uniref:DUF2249 domain-containing protein n=1 Tax=Thermoactinomyces intermedius TaxID=2024 RepID=A0A8I1AAI9_THEIN|nr:MULTISPECIES: DUF2249 domain-containing protein [Thermoactinomyces]MBA4549539.1 DUF2249 domain-containing protein [Thermoactinomyces intermedius]MBA4837189.1 DUF2249 domain-containing protein [Thermoactinomyces intermedius]MBH8596030.1 DUF2249 domain-containing protein [Thermoactinomyces intermedius]MBH8602160.1 DUF2249 domain-containing protein [Thermoactinomyces sp. CICC 23799]